MTTYTDQEIKDILHQQEQNFKVTARGFGFQAKEAQRHLERLSGMSEDQKINATRESLMKLRN